MINKLNKIHRSIFGWHQFLLAIVGVIGRRVIAYFSLPQQQQVVTLGDTVIDTILMFLIFSLLLTFLGIILCLYTTGSNGIKAKYPFEVKNAYKYLASLATRNVAIIGLYLALYDSAVVVWAYQYKQYTSGAIVVILIIISILIAFVIEIAGIQRGIAKSKWAMLSKIKLEMDKVQPLHDSLIDSVNKDLTSKLFEINMILEKLSNRAKDIEEINEWMIGVESAIKIALTLISTILIPAVRIILKI